MKFKNVNVIFNCLLLHLRWAFFLSVNENKLPFPKGMVLPFLALLFSGFLLHAESINSNTKEESTLKSDSNSFNTETSNLTNIQSTKIKLKNKIIPLTNPVYFLLDYYETEGILSNLPQVRPYKKINVVNYLLQLSNHEQLNEREKKVVSAYLADFTQDSNSFEFMKQSSENAFLLVGTGAKSTVRMGGGEQASWSSTNLIQPYFAGDLGENITFVGNLNVGVEQLSPDFFYQSYTNNGNVYFPFESFGYSFLPYQFQFETNYIHYNRGWSPPIDDKWQLALYYAGELNASWLDDALQLSFNNQQRSWGHVQKNLLLSGTARRFPGIEMKIQPFEWFRYSYVVGSLFWLPAEHNGYRQSVYGEDTGRPQKMLSCHLIELMPFPWLQISGANNVIWPKRLELSYLAPLVPPSLVQDNIGDQDNPSLYFDVAAKMRGFGKAWLGFYIDDFSLTDSWQMLKYVTNKYGFQMGWRTNLLSSFIPGTTSTFGFTRVTPFVYTHYPEIDFSTGNNRPIDITYTHDGFNLGFYLPPNSAELSWSLVNIAFPDLVLSLDNRLIMHGTNDLSSENIYQIYGDIYYHHKGNINNYPLLDFTKDGIYDYSFQSEFSFDWKIRTKKTPSCYRLTGSLGYSSTWWETNNSGVTAPESRQLFTGSIGIIVEM